MTNPDSRKKLALAGMLILCALALWRGIVLLIRGWEWLAARHLTGLGIVLLGGFFVSTLVAPLLLRRDWEALTPGGVVRGFLRRGGAVLGVLTAVFGALWLAGVLIALVRRHNLLVIPLLLALGPLAQIGWDLARGAVKRTPRNLFVGYARHAFQDYYVLLVQFVTVPLAFILFPAGFFLLLMSVIDALLRFVLAVSENPTPLLCQWAEIGDPVCVPGLVGFHLTHLALAFLAYLYRDRFMEQTAVWFEAGQETLAGWMDNDSK